MSSHRPVCAKCQTELRPKKNGQTVLDFAGIEPYQIWSADLFACPGCNCEIVIGFGAKPLAEYFEDTFIEKLSLYGTPIRNYEHAQKEADHAK